jgi:hypothetical protein
MRCSGVEKQLEQYWLALKVLSSLCDGPRADHFGEAAAKTTALRLETDLGINPLETIGFNNAQPLFELL